MAHFNDWQSALGPWFLRAEHHDDPWLAGARSVFTIHNLAYQGMFDKAFMDVLGLPWSIFRMDRGVEFHDKLNFMKAGLSFADALTTVSPNYAREILTVDGGYGLDTVLRSRSGDLYGILNGIDDREWNPAHDPHLPFRYDRHDLRGKVRVKAALQAELGLPVKPHVPLVGLVGRLADQKGVDLLAAATPALLRSDAQFALLGSGQREFEQFFAWVGRERPDRFAARIGFDEGLAHRIEAGADAVPHAQPLRALRAEPDVQPALRDAAGGPGGGRPGRHGRGLRRLEAGNRLPLRAARPGGADRGDATRPRRLARRARLAGHPGARHGHRLLLGQERRTLRGALPGAGRGVARTPTYPPRRLDGAGISLKKARSSARSAR